jgi:very-short-patch-repair endonuclease
LIFIVKIPTEGVKMNECKICKVELKNKKRTYCSNKCKFSDDAYNSSRANKTKNPILQNVKCNECGWLSIDVLNKSGGLGKHLLLNHKITTPNVNDWFVKVDVVEKEKLKCPLCLWGTDDITNKSGAFTSHLNKLHNMSIGDFLKHHPKFNSLWKTYQTKEKVVSFIKENETNRIECLECGCFFRKLTNMHLIKHKMTPTQYKDKYGLVTTCSLSTSELQRKGSFDRQINDVFDRIYAHDCTPLFSLDEYSRVCGGKKYKFKCNICAFEFEDTLDDGGFPLCRPCNPKLEFKPNRKLEIEVYDFLRSKITGPIIKNDRKTISPKEIDFYMPHSNIAIEIDGLFWHGERYKTNKYHIEKTLQLKQKGIRTIHIFEDEWDQKRELVNRKIVHILGKSDSEKIYARKCDVREITSEECCPFLNRNHIQGKDSSYLKIGAFYDGKLVSVMTFSKPRIALGNKGNEEFVELSRFASDIDFITVGTASKLFSYFLKNYNPTKIISYADLRWTDFNKNLYTTLGFAELSRTVPNYFWCKNKKRHHRFGFTKQKLVKLGHDSNKTEVEIMHELGYYRIWDCGHLKYEWNKTEL